MKLSRFLLISSLFLMGSVPMFADAKATSARGPLHPTGLIVPKNWRHGANFVKQTPLRPDEKLPASFDWRAESNGLTPIQNQGNCGSCWAFSTTSTFADTILIHDQQTRSLSQQYLVSCDNHGWNCKGGWFAHDMFQEFGAVYSSDLPYTGKDSSCPANLQYHEKIENWAYVGSPSGSLPDTNDIKRAIMDFGPVSVAVNVTFSFQFYRSGIFSSCDKSTENDLNHAVNLVGWNDDGGYWIMRNSWGKGWGENGYMRIKYGCNLIGFSASYQNYKPSCTPQPVAAAGLDKTIKAGESVQIGSEKMQGESFSWSPVDDLDDPTSSTPIATPKKTVVYTVSVKNSCGIAASQVQITVPEQQ